MPFQRKTKGKQSNSKRTKRLKQSQPVKQNGKNYIDSLPDELLYMVFDLLNLKSVKAASLTCRKWNNILFSSVYTNRFTFVIDAMKLIPSIPLSFVSRAKDLASQALRVLAHTRRSYRNVRWSASSCMNLYNSTIFTTIDQQFANYLTRLELSLDYSTTVDIFPRLVQTVPQMSQLRTLQLKDSDWNSFCFSNQDIIPTLRSETLRHLMVRSQFKFWVDLPQLESFNGSLSVIDRPERILEPLAVPSLKFLTISVAETDNEFKTRQPTVIRLLPPVEAMHWKVKLSSDEVFLTICESCTTLTELGFHRSLCLSNIGVYSNLDKLINLRVLTINDLKIADESPLDLDFSPLTKLEKLSLAAVVDSVTLPKSVQMLELGVNQNNEQSMINTILDCSEQLKELVLSLCVELPEDMPTEMLKILPRLKNLVVLEIENGYFGESTFLCLESPMERLRTLKLYEDHLRMYRFLQLKEKFPNLKELVIESLEKVSKSTNPDLYSLSAADFTSRSSRFGSSAEFESYFTSPSPSSSDSD